MNQEKVGQFIKQLRKDNKLTQAEFASKYNVTYQAVSNWEQGKNLPDISLLKQMSKDFNVSIDSILEGKQNKKKYKHSIYKIITIVIVIILIIISIKIIINNSSNFEFKTISSNCPNFTISGSISYNKNKTSIYISNVNYCNGDDSTIYKTINCSLYEHEKDTSTKISDCKTKSNNINLEEYLKQVEFTIDDYSHSCKNYTDNSLYLLIDATDEFNKTTTYKIPLALNSTCEY